MTRLATITLLLTSVAIAQPPQPPCTSPPVLDGAEFTPDSKTVLVRFFTMRSSGNSRHTALYDVPTGKKLAGPDITAPRPGWATEALHPDGTLLLLSRPLDGAKDWDTRELVLWNWRTGREVRAFDPPVTLFDRAAFTPDGKCVVSTHRDNRVLIWDTAKGRRSGALDRPQTPYSVSAGPTVVVTADSGKLVTADSDGLTTWDLTSGRKVPRAAVPARSVRGDLAACSADGGDAVSVFKGSDRDQAGVWAWDLKGGRLRRELAFPEGYVAAAVVTEHGRVLAANGQGVVRAWDANGKLLWRASLGKWKGSRVVFSAAFSADGRFLLTDGEKTTLQMWDTEKRKVVWSADEQR